MLRQRFKVAATITAIVLTSLLFAASARAQCGAFCIYEVGSPQMGSSYAGAGATAQDAATAYLNPAGMTRLDRAELLNGLYGAWFHNSFDADFVETVPPEFPGPPPPPPVGFTNDGGSLDSFLPGLGTYAVVPIAEDFRAGLAVNGLFGGSLDYRDGWVGRTFITDIELLILNIQPTLAWRVTDWLSVGAGLNVLRAELSEYQLRASPALDAPKIKADNADDWAVDFTVGVLLEPREGTRIGLVYRDEAEMTLTGGDAPNFRYEFDLPRGANFSLFHQVTERFALLFDAGWSDWSAFSQQEIVIAGLDVSFSRRWKDTYRVGVGFQYRLGQRWLFQSGVSYDSSPVKDSRRTPDLPMDEQIRLSAGIQVDLRENLTAGVSYTLLSLGTAEIDSVDLPPAVWGATLDGDYDPNLGHFLGVTLEWSFCSPLPWVDCPAPTGASQDRT